MDLLLSVLNCYLSIEAQFTHESLCQTQTRHRRAASPSAIEGALQPAAAGYVLPNSGPVCRDNHTLLLLILVGIEGDILRLILLMMRWIVLELNRQVR